MIYNCSNKMLSNITFVITFCLFTHFVSTDWIPPVYDINLEDSPEHRWDRVIIDHKYGLDYIRNLTKHILPNKHIAKVVFSLAKGLERMFPKEYAQELKGVARESGLPLGEIVLLNVLYDLTAFRKPHYSGPCTSIVASDKQGCIWHGRNLDYRRFGNFLRNMTIMVNFKRNKQIVFSSLSFAYSVGTFTGQQPGVFSISLNERFSGSFIDNILMAILTGFQHPASLVVRQVLQYGHDYLSVTKYLSHVWLVAPCYFTVGGLNKYQGVIITRNRLDSADLWYLNSTQWFIVETNYDHWKETPPHDRRRQAANKGLKKIGRKNLNPKTMFQVLSKAPVQNYKTIFSTVISASHPKVFHEYSIVRELQNDE